MSKQTKKKFDVRPFTYEIIGPGKVAVAHDLQNRGRRIADIPSKVQFQDTEYTVVAIADKAFMYCAELREIHIPHPQATYRKQPSIRRTRLALHSTTTK